MNFRPLSLLVCSLGAMAWSGAASLAVKVHACEPTQ